MGPRPFEFKHDEKLCATLGITEEEERIVDMLMYTLEGYLDSEHKNDTRVFSNLMHTTFTRMEIPAESMEGVIIYLLSVVRSALVRYANLETATALKNMLSSLSGHRHDEDSSSALSGVVGNCGDPGKQAAIKKRIDEALAEISKEFDCTLHMV